MNLTRCKKGHYYDSDKYAGCPHCAQKNNVARNTIRMSDNVDSEQTERKRDVQGKALKDAVMDALEKKRESEVQQSRAKNSVREQKLPTGIMVGVSGNQKGKLYSLGIGSNYIGLVYDEVQIVEDREMLSETFATITYHEDRNLFVIKPVGAEQTVQIGRMVLRESIMLRPYDKILVNGDALMFVPICGEHFKWTE